jgi:hypothetical protein
MGSLQEGIASTLKLPFERRAMPLVGGGVGCCMGAW